LSHPKSVKGKSLLSREVAKETVLNNEVEGFEQREMLPQGAS
jgi:hypothetical protein